ncbi:hypothetical protein M0R45_009224 [Rubus argutus]|uniref:Uncharacterized protein n=1 Tax=Rubus argutus TaxID=59490 RepID=A0AAW1Y2Y4_RUBAR
MPLCSQGQTRMRFLAYLNLSAAMLSQIPNLVSFFQNPSIILPNSNAPTLPFSGGGGWASEIVDGDGLGAAWAWAEQRRTRQGARAGCEERLGTARTELLGTTTARPWARALVL